MPEVLPLPLSIQEVTFNILEMTRSTPPLTMALSIQKPFKEMKLDPANVQTMNEANLIRNLYSRLVEYNQQGELVTAAASAFEIVNNKIIFTVRGDLTSSIGRTVTAEDFYLSLKRLLVLDKNTHGDLKTILCGTQDKIEMDRLCPGLSFKDNNLIVEPLSANRVKYLIPLMASVDFSVVPKDAIDWKSKDLAITNYKNTSGAYYLAKDFSGEDKSLILKANINSFYHSKDMPQEILILSANKDDAASLFISKKIDFIPTSYSWSANMLELIKSDDVDNHETYPIKIWAVRFTSEGLKKSNAQERSFIGQALKAKFSEIYSDEKMTFSKQMFPKLSEGSLTEEEIATLQTPDPAFKLNRKIKLGIPRGDLAQFKAALGKYDWIEFVELLQPPWTLEPSKQPDCYITFGDSSFFEDLSLISNQMSMGTFNLSKEEGVKWMQTYLDIEEKTKRLEMLKSLHLKTLQNSYIIPIGFTNFYSFSRNNWKLNFSKYYVGNPYWQIRWKK